MNRVLLILAATVGLSLGIAHASSTADEWVVVPASQGPMTPLMQRVTDEIGTELERRVGRVRSSPTATSEFERMSSTEPIRLSAPEVDRWVADSQAGLRHLALGEHQDALRYLERAEEFSRASLTFLNREESHAQRVLDTCLYMVRTLLEIGNESGARQRAHECAVIAPGTSPQELMHPPSTLALFQDAFRKGADSSRRLWVESDRDGCTVRINGVASGVTPLEWTATSDGTYAVQVECLKDEHGRVHTVHVRQGTTTLEVDSAVEETVRTEPMLRLQYRDRTSTDVRKSAALGVARALSARWVLLVSRLSPNQIVLDLIGDSQSHMGCARIEVEGDRIRSDLLLKAVRNVVEGRCGRASAWNPRSLSESDPVLFKPEI